MPSIHSCSTLMLLPPHTTMTTACLPSCCSHLMTLLCSRQGSSTRTFLSSAEGETTFFSPTVDWHQSRCAPVRTWVILPYKSFKSFYSLLVCQYLWEDRVPLCQVHGLCWDVCQAQCGCQSREPNERLACSTRREAADAHVRKCTVVVNGS